MRLGGLVARNRSFGNIPKRIKSSLNANQVIVECGLSIPLGRGLQLGEAASPRWPLILQHFIGWWVVCQRLCPQVCPKDHSFSNSSMLCNARWGSQGFIWTEG
jgi:hypothetical protein